MRSRTSEPGSISQKRARSKSGPSAGTATLNRVTATVLLKSPIVEKPPADVRRTEGDEEGILADGRADWSDGGSAGGFRRLVPLGGRGLRLLLGGLLGSGCLSVSSLGGLGGGLGNRGAILGRLSRRGFGRRSEEHTSELQSHVNLVCRLLLEKKKNKT